MPLSCAKARQKNDIGNVNPQGIRSSPTLGCDDDWPLPIQLVQKGGKWLFDTKPAEKEILLRRMVPRKETSKIFAGLCGRPT